MRSRRGRRGNGPWVKLLRKHERGGQHESDGNRLESPFKIPCPLCDHSDDRQGKEGTETAKGVYECERRRCRAPTQKFSGASPKRPEIARESGGYGTPEHNADGQGRHCADEV